MLRLAVPEDVLWDGYMSQLFFLFLFSIFVSLWAMSKLCVYLLFSCHLSSYTPDASKETWKIMEQCNYAQLFLMCLGH